MKGSFHMTDRKNKVIVGIDFATHDSDFSVVTVMHRKNEVSFEVLESAIIGKGIPDETYKREVLKKYEKFCNQ